MKKNATARRHQQHRPYDGSEQYHQRADKPDQDDKQTEKEVRLVTCDSGDSAQDVEGGIQNVDYKDNDHPKEADEHCKCANSKLHYKSSPFSNQEPQDRLQVSTLPCRRYFFTRCLQLSIDAHFTSPASF